MLLSREEVSGETTGGLEGYTPKPLKLPRILISKGARRRMLRLKFLLSSLFLVTLSAAIFHVTGYAGARSLTPINSAKPGSLCTQGEQVLWSCETAKERKLASVCGSKNLDGTHGYVQYRFGRAGRVEMEFPRERANTQSAFKYSRYTRYMVTYLKLEFVNNGFTYTVSDDSNYEEKPGSRDADITITPAGANAKETKVRCRLPVTGSLMKLEDVVERRDYTLLVKPR
jgi:hypothetical protein